MPESDGEQLDFSAVQKPEQIMETALAESDFKKKLAFIENTKLELATISQVNDVVSAFQHEHRELIANSFRRGFDRRKDFISEWERFAIHFKSPAFTGLKIAADESFGGFSEAYYYSLQAIVYLSMYSERVSRNMLFVLNKSTGLSEETKRDFISQANQLSKIAQSMSGMAESLRER